MTIPRVHFYEIHEQPWFPESARPVVTQMIPFFWRIFGSRSAAAKSGRILARVLRESGSSRIVDCCSGSGGPIIDQINCVTDLLGNDSGVDFVLTDLYPSLDDFEKLKQQFPHYIHAINSSVDAINFPLSRIKNELAKHHIHNGVSDAKNDLLFRLFNASFHHFDVVQAKQILRDCVEKDTGIIVFEPAERSWITLMGIIRFPLTIPAWFLISWFITLFLIPKWFGLTRYHILWTFLIPIAPLVFFFDSFMSCLRFYSPSELNAMIQEVDPTGKFHWEIGREHVFWPVMTLSYLVGYPKKS